ncbi:Rho GTPase-activating protein 8 [Intoshia linei]|uniref:Rho GTPase-activating protein 8 n=1 Tax=Intoshia linei TaxID=1819745 RepID=A0A177AUQ7_9BILA|nr:Rho GTPase-activating protein 8 [Intoshia linei]
MKNQPDEIEEIKKYVIKSKEESLQYDLEDENKSLKSENLSLAIKDYLADLKFLEIGGFNNVGQTIVILHASRLPKIDHHNEVKKYLISKLSDVVTCEYIIVLFYQGMTWDNQPTFTWIKDCYKELNLNFRKNLKRVYIIKSSLLVKLLLLFMKQFISHKFYRKIFYVDNVDSLEIEHGIQIKIEASPESESIDETLHLNTNLKLKRFGLSSTILSRNQCFGVSLSYIKKNGNMMQNSAIPTFLAKIIKIVIFKHLRQPFIFRTTPSVLRLNPLIEQINQDEPVNFNELDCSILAGLIKLFFRKLPEPLITFDLYDVFINVNLHQDKSLNFIRKTLRANINGDYCELLALLLYFLNLIDAYSEFNHMTCSNLAIIWSQNIMYPHRTDSFKYNSNFETAKFYAKKSSDFVQFLIKNVLKIYHMPKSFIEISTDLPHDDGQINSGDDTIIN